jgi:hypothetical protein
LNFKPAARRPFMAGQPMGLVNGVKPIKIVAEMMAEAEDEFQSLSQELCAPGSRPAPGGRP